MISWDIFTRLAFYISCNSGILCSGHSPVVLTRLLSYVVQVHLRPGTAARPGKRGTISQAASRASHNTTFEVSLSRIRFTELGVDEADIDLCVIPNIYPWMIETRIWPGRGEGKGGWNAGWAGSGHEWAAHVTWVPAHSETLCIPSASQARPGRDYNPLVHDPQLLQTWDKHWPVTNNQATALLSRHNLHI